MDCSGLWVIVGDTLILICCQNILFSIVVADTGSHCHECHPISNSICEHLLTSVVWGPGGRAAKRYHLFMPTIIGKANPYPPEAKRQ